MATKAKEWKINKHVQISVQEQVEDFSGHSTLTPNSASSKAQTLEELRSKTRSQGINIVDFKQRRPQQQQQQQQLQQQQQQLAHTMVSKL